MKTYCKPMLQVTLIGYEDVLTTSTEKVDGLIVDEVWSGF